MLAAATAVLASAGTACAQTGGVPGGTDPQQPQPSAETPATTAGSWTVTKKATWYGPGFWGHSTACGMTLQPTTLGVAHRKLPCGTQVTFNYNGVSVAATVIDRGPFRKGYAFDMTKAVAKQLGFLTVGAAPVQATITPPAAVPASSR